MQQTGATNSGGVRSMPAQWNGARACSRTVRAVAGVAVLALMGVTRSVPAETVQRDAARPACAIHIALVHASRAVGPAIFRISVSDSSGKPLAVANVHVSATAVSATTDDHGAAVLVLPAGQTPREITLIVRRVGYAALPASVTVMPGDTVTATAALCPSRTIMPMITTSPAMRTPTPEPGDTTSACASAVSVVRWDTTGRAAPNPGDAIVRGHITDSAGSRVLKGSIAVHPGIPGHVLAAIAGGFTDLHGDVAFAVRASDLGRGMAMVVAVRGLPLIPASLPVHLAPGDTLTIRAALCPSKYWLSESGAADAGSVASTRLSIGATPSLHVDASASGTASLDPRSHIDAWGAGIGAVALGLAGYGYERGLCDVVASRCTGRHGAIVGAVIGAFLGYTIGQVLTPPAASHTRAAGSGCLPGDTPDAARLLAVARLMVTADTGDFASARSMYHFPHMSAEHARTQVAVVRAPEVCTRVAAAFRRVVRDSVSTGPLYVIAVGEMFWVYDPARETTASEFQPYVSFYPDLRVAGIGAT